MDNNDISNGRCKACDIEFGHRDVNEDLCGHCRSIAMQAAYGKNYWDHATLDDPTAEFLQYVDSEENPHGGGHDLDRAADAYAESNYNDAYSNQGWERGYDY